MPRHSAPRIFQAFRPDRRRLILSAKLLSLLGTAAVLSTCGRPPDVLSQVQKTGELRLATINSATTYYRDRDGAKGFEYDLARSFAESLGVKLKVVPVIERDDIIQAVRNNKAQLGAGLSPDAASREQLLFTPPYFETRLVSVYRQGSGKPASMDALSGHLVLPDAPALTEWLHRQYPDLEFTIDHNASTEELMARVADGHIGATIANEKLVAMNQRYHPKLRKGITLEGTDLQRAWALARHAPTPANKQLYYKARQYLDKDSTQKRIDVLDNRYFGHARKLGFVGGAEFARQVKRRLDRWRPHFKEAAQKYDIDWRLLAAIAYQESRWNEQAVSPTYVHGLMMLTRDTAEHTDTADRRDPVQSIDGGTRYLLELRDQLPEQIKAPDRTWFALAAYNLGLGHVMDARRLLVRAGRDPNLWINLRKALGWLTEQKHARHTHHGYAPGTVAADYVSNIRAYYDILLWMTRDKDSGQGKTPLDDKDPASSHDSDTSDRQSTISIQSPAL